LGQNPALADLPHRLVKTHPDGTVRTGAVEAIGEMGGLEAVKILAEPARGRKL